MQLLDDPQMEERNRERLAGLGLNNPAGYVDGANLYQMELGNPVDLVDPFGLQGTRPTTQPTTQPALPVFKGFEDDRYQQHDALINELVADFNAHKGNYCGCNADQSKKVTDLDPALVKAWLIQETGGNDATSRAAWGTDPAQVNVPGDWNQYKADLGLTKPQQRNEGDLRTNLIAALKYLCRKGFGGSGQPARNRPTGFFDGWPTALQRYGPPNRRDFYGPQILKRSHNPGEYVPIEPD